MLLDVINDNVSTDSGNVVLMFDRELRYKQQLDIIIEPKYAQFSQRLYINMLFDLNNVKQEINIFNIAFKQLAHKRRQTLLTVTGIAISVMVAVDFNRVPKCRWCHKRIRSF